MKKNLLPIIVIALIIGAIGYLESQKVDLGSSVGGSDIAIQSDASNKKTPLAKEITNPSGFINTDPFTIEQFIGKKVIMVDFWTYSCINCQRTTPYLNAWWDKYEKEGLLIIGVHTPEFEFEKKLENVQQAAEKFGIEYPIVLDNDYGTWRAYNNSYWPRKYLIDIDGHIAYDHIGEGGYAETERVIQELLQERMTRLGEQGEISQDIVQEIGQAGLGKQLTPETYFGSARNSLLANGKTKTSGTFTFTQPSETSLDRFSLVGDWKIEPEFAQTVSAGNKILLHYRASKVYMVAGSEKGTTISVKQDGQAIGSQEIQAEQLYTLVNDQTYGEHTLEITINDAGLEAYTFTFG